MWNSNYHFTTIISVKGGRGEEGGGKEENHFSERGEGGGGRGEGGESFQ